MGDCTQGAALGWNIYAFQAFSRNSHRIWVPNYSSLFKKIHWVSQRWKQEPRVYENTRLEPRGYWSLAFTEASRLRVFFPRKSCLPVFRTLNKFRCKSLISRCCFFKMGVPMLNSGMFLRKGWIKYPHTNQYRIGERIPVPKAQRAEIF